MLAFTGTPISGAERNTREVFGDHIDVYDLKRAADDGASVRAFHESRVIQLVLDEEADGLDDTEPRRVEQAVAERVTRLHDNSALFLRLASEARVEVGTSGGTPIVPCVTGDSMKALHLADRLYNRGICANPILHPAVEERLARLRFFITSEHTEEQITATIQILAEEPARPF